MEFPGLWGHSRGSVVTPRIFPKGPRTEPRKDHGRPPE